MDYYDLYTKRVNRYGADHTSRIQSMREKEFEHYLSKSTYKVEFIYNGEELIGSLEPYKQDETKTLQYLLININITFAAGTILTIDSKHWMVYYLEQMAASGYNRYILLKMSHQLSWMDGGVQRTSYAYLFGNLSNAVRDTLKSIQGAAAYLEDSTTNCFILPRNQYIKKDTYLEVGAAPFTQSYRVTGYDLQSTEGVEYVTIDTVYKYDLSAPPTQSPTDPEEDFYWINGGLS